jgi:hypothetical protein
MLRRIVFCRLLCVVGSLEMVSVSQVSVMCCLFMRARLMLLGRFKMMACGLLMVLGCLLVVLCTLMSSHLLWSPFCECALRAPYQMSSI